VVPTTSLAFLQRHSTTEWWPVNWLEQQNDVLPNGRPDHSRPDHPDAACHKQVAGRREAFAACGGKDQAEPGLGATGNLGQKDLTTFGVGRGIAIPHAIVDGIATPVGAFARLKQLIDFDAVDGQPADLVFLILAPATGADMLLLALACVARRLQDREVTVRLRAETSSEGAHVILTADSWRGHDPHPVWKHAA
jgi:mannitol/fructose-specific phosphotransferase system IIA component